MKDPDCIYIRGGWVITVSSNSYLMKNSGVFIENGIITEIGKVESLDSKYKGKCDIEIDATRSIVMPGLINTHVHLAQGIMRGCAEYLRLHDWLRNVIWPLQNSMKEQEAIASAKLVISEMLKSGITTFLETMMLPNYGIDNIIEFILKSGIRAALSRHISPFSLASDQGGMWEDKNNSVNDLKRLYYKYHGQDDRVWVWISPRTIIKYAQEVDQVSYLKDISSLARELNTGITMHFVETEEERTLILREFKRKPIELLQLTGMLGKNVTLVHSIWLDHEEIELLARTRTNVSYNPCSNMKLASGVAKIPEMIKLGVNVSLGTDGGPSNNTYDLLREMKHAVLLQSIAYMNPAVIRAEDVIEMATINGAKALMIDHLVGSIEVGKKADIIIIDYWQPHLIPMNNPVSHIVYCASGHDVKHVIINGKLIVHNKKIQTINEEEILKEAEKAFESLSSRAGVCREVETWWHII
ncbi:MAG: amidohydrolase [Zestosphaera sp.]